VTKNSRACCAIARGDLAHIVAPKIEKIDGRALSFAGGESATVDVVLCCTGYGGSFEWISTDIGYDCSKNCVRGFYKHSFPPGWGHCLAFAGYTRGHQGGIPQMGEMVARCAARVFSGRLALPKDYAARAEAEAELENKFFVLSPHLKPLVDYPSYMDSMARWLGCQPTVPWFRPALLFKYLMYPLWPCWFRLDGVGANRAAAMAVLDKFPISTAWRVNIYCVIAGWLYFWSRLVAIFTYPFAPKTGIDNFGLWMWTRPKHYILHGNTMRFADLFRP
jgi:dimethylaniline monooxygenase (N-oxide forming)